VGPADGDPDLIARWRTWLQGERATLRESYRRQPAPRRLLRQHTRIVDQLLRNLWRAMQPVGGSALVATGGYGRRDLFPHSDVDLLLLLPRDPDPVVRERIERLVGALWDVGLDVGHSVRTVQGCVEEAAADITVRTTLLEGRLLAGSRGAFRALQDTLAGTFDAAAFFEAKKLEQEQRHAKHRDTAYALEPNLKEAPGGLRDLHVIQWIALGCGLGARWTDLERHGLVLHGEALQLARSEAILQDLRIRLHFLAGRREDRIVFDLQTALAEDLSIAPAGVRRAGEVLMQRYYRNAKNVTQLNVILLQNLGARLNPNSDEPPRALNERFCARGEWLEAIDETLFEREPRAILESFLLLQQHRTLRGMTAGTLRALWRARNRVDARFRRDVVSRHLFVLLLQQPRGIVHEFRRMNQYGVLGRYLPEFGRIVGQMQHDLFHVYTVDQHILMVLRNLRRFSSDELSHEFPLCSRLTSDFDRRWLLYVAALFHDIAKGRGGDHSQLGSQDARRFCRRHNLMPEDTDLVCFLVEKHLTMSSVAQKEDIHDPEVIQAFAAVVRDERRLIALYLLTVADVRGTSPKVWNGWKAKLLEDLFLATRRALTGHTLQPEAALSERQAEAMRLLRLHALPEGVADALWANLDTPYFLRHDAKEIAWQARALHARTAPEQAIVVARLSPFGEGLQIMVYARDRKALFARICGYFDRTNFDIVEAKVHTTRHGYALDTFLVLGGGDGTQYRDMMSMIEKDLAEDLDSQAPIAPSAGGRLSRRARHFPVTPVVDIRLDERDAYSVLSIVANDRPGLLYGIAAALAAHSVRLHTAKINTLGDRAEDVFLASGDTLADPKAVLSLEQELLRTLAPRQAIAAIA